MYRAYMGKDGQSYWNDDKRITYEEFMEGLTAIVAADAARKAWHSEPHPDQRGGLSAMVPRGR